MKRLITLLVLAIILGLNLASQNSKSGARIGSVDGKEASLNRKSKLETKMNPRSDERMKAEKGAVLQKDSKEKGKIREKTIPFPNVKQGTVHTRAANSLPAPWSEGFEDGTTLSDLSIYDMDGDETMWTISPYTAHSGTSSAFHSWGVSGIQEDGWLILPQINIPSGKVFRLSFWSINGATNDYGKNSVLISTGSADPADEDFEEVWSPASVTGEWVETKIDLADYAGENIYVAFRYEGEYAHSWFIDDISLVELFEGDAGVTAIVSPVSGTLTGEETIQIKVKNFGLEALTDVPVKVSIDGGTPVSGTVPSLGIDQEVEYTFPVSFDFSEPKTYELTAYTELPGDGNPANDAYTVNVINVGDCTVSVFPYEEDVENDLTLLCWNDFYYDEDGADVGWTVETLTGAHSGNRVVYHYYSSQQDGWMVSPQIKIPSTGIYALSFWSFNRYPNDYYLGKNSVWISTGSADPADGDFEEVWSPDEVEAAWVETKIKLADYAGEDIYVAFRYEGHYAHIWYLDDLRIAELLPYDAGVSQIVSPMVNNGGENAAPVKVKVTNFGDTPLTSVALAYEFNGGSPVVETFIPETPIALDATDEYTFTQTVDLSTIKEELYTIKVYTQLAGDGNASNDTASIAFPCKGHLQWYGYRIYDSSWEDMSGMGAVSFNTHVPSEVNTISDYTDNGSIIYSGEYVDGYIYVYTNSSSFIKLTSDWTEVSKTTITELATDMAYDYSTGTMYALGYDSDTDTPQLKTVNLETGAMTSVADLDRNFVTLSIDLAGNLYAIDVAGDFTSINKTTGAVTVIGSTGVAPAYIQSAAFDHNTGRLFWAMCNTADEGKLLEIDPATGAVYDFGTLGGDAEIVALYTPYTYVEAPELVEINIEDEAIDVDPDLAIVLTFDKAVTAEAGLDGIQFVKDGTSEAVEITPSISENVLTIAHAKLAFKTKYNLTIPEGTIDRFEGEIALSFTTADGGALPETKLPQAFTVFPNPSKGKVYLSSVPEKSKVTVLDLTGRTVGTCTLSGGNNVPLNLPLSSGVYFIHIESAATKVIQKLVIE